MYQDFYDYIRKLHLFIESQEKRIRRLETLLEESINDIKDLKRRPPITVDRIEYKFDQLKVEKLDGTLNIGLNPTDMQGIEDFAVGNQSPKTPMQPAEQMRSVMEIEDEIIHFVDSDTEKIITSSGANLNKNVDTSFYAFIKDDIKKQLPGRIEFYLNKIPLENRLPENEEVNKQNVIQQLKTDIEKGIEAFVRNLPETGKE